MIDTKKSTKITQFAKALALAVQNGSSSFFAKLQNDYDPFMQDDLTRLYNRRAFRKSREGLNNYILLLLDIDNFKSINDVFGHQAGDKVLKSISKLIRSETDRAFRVGGEEFAILIEGSPFEALCLGSSILKRILNTSILKGKRITASIGGARYQASKTHEEVYRRADRALYSAKRRGKNRLVAAV